MDYDVSRPYHSFPWYVRIFIAQTCWYMFGSFANDFKTSYYGVISLLIPDKLLEGYTSYETLGSFDI